MKIYSRKFFISPIQPDNFAMSPNGNIYFPEKYFSEDFSKNDFYDQAWFVHEVMHIYQYQKENQWMTLKGFFLGMGRFFGFNPYKYKIDFSKNISDYNMEQQGDIARDYFLIKKGLKKVSQKEFDWYQKNILSLR